MPPPQPALTHSPRGRPPGQHTGTTHSPNSSSLSTFVVGRRGSFRLRGSWLPAGRSFHTERWSNCPEVSVALYLRGSRAENPDTGSEARPAHFHVGMLRQVAHEAQNFPRATKTRIFCNGASTHVTKQLESLKSCHTKAHKHLISLA